MALYYFGHLTSPTDSGTVEIGGGSYTYSIVNTNVVGGDPNSYPRYLIDNNPTGTYLLVNTYSNTTYNTFSFSDNLTLHEVSISGKLSFSETAIPVYFQAYDSATSTWVTLGTVTVTSTSSWTTGVLSFSMHDKTYSKFRTTTFQNNKSNLYLGDVFFTFYVPDVVANTGYSYIL